MYVYQRVWYISSRSIYVKFFQYTVISGGGLLLKFQYVEGFQLSAFSLDCVKI